MTCSLGGTQRDVMVAMVLGGTQRDVVVVMVDIRLDCHF